MNLNVHLVATCPNLTRIILSKGGGARLHEDRVQSTQEISRRHGQRKANEVKELTARLVSANNQVAEVQQALAHKESELAQLFKQNQDLTFLVSGADQKYQELLEQARKVIGEKDSVIAQ